LSISRMMHRPVIFAGPLQSETEAAINASTAETLWAAHR
jgi:hypothetical protein